MQTLKRKQLQEKEAFHNMTISVPFFISGVPTRIVAVSKDNDLTRHKQHHHKICFSGTRFIRTKLLYFSSLQSAIQFYKAYSERAKAHPQLKLWCEYCKDLTNMAGVLYQEGKIYVSYFESKELREFLNEVSQLVVVDGAAAEELMRRQDSVLFRFLDEDTISLEQYYYRWRVYSYLQNEGERRYRTEPFQMIYGGSEWYPPVSGSIQRGMLTRAQRRYFHELLFGLTRGKRQIEQGMVFCIFNIVCAVQIVQTIVLQIFDRLHEDFIKYFYLISDILFNTTTQNYRRLFARIIPFVIYYYAKERKSIERERKDEARYRGQLKALIQIWEIKFIFEESYTKGLSFLLDYFVTERKSVGAVHEKLRKIGEMEDERESEMEMQKFCFDHGIPLLENDKEESMKIINQLLWRESQEESIQPEPEEVGDGEPLNEKDLLKIKNKQVKVVCCQGLPVSMLLQKSWQTRGRAGHSNSVDSS